MKQTLKKLLSSSPLSLGLLSIFLLTVALILQGTVAYADPCKMKDYQPSDNSTDSDCYKANFKTANGLDSAIDAKTFSDAVSDCVGENYVIAHGSGQWVQYNDTGTCSNAIASCLQTETNQKACLDPNVLAVGANCTTMSPGSTNGDVGGSIGAGGDCGWEQIVSSYADVKNNADQRYQMIQDLYGKACDAEAKNKQDASAYTKCTDTVGKNAIDCSNAEGGTNAPFDQAKFNTCMQGKAQTAGQCGAAGGSFDSATSKCNPPAPPAPPPAPCTDPGQGGVDPKDSTKCANGDTIGAAKGPGGSIQPVTGRCGEARVNILACGDTDKGAAAINDVLKIAIGVLTVLVGIAAVGGLAWASVLYAKAGDNEGNVSDAKTLIRNVVIGILLYGFLVAIVNYLVPGNLIG